MPESYNEQYCQQASNDYVQALKGNASAFVSNVKTEVDFVALSTDMGVPVTINFEEYENSYVCSPYTALVPYCKEELDKVGSGIVRFAVSILIAVFDSLLKALKINRVYQANNWFLSTNLFPLSFSKEDVRKTRDAVKNQYPNHALMFRSLNRHCNQQLLNDFISLDYILLPTRQVYIFDKQAKNYSESHNYHIDKGLLAKTTYTIVQASDIVPSDIPRIVELYTLLYIEKYSDHNPKFTERYTELVLQHPNFTLEAFRNSEGVIDAVGGRFEMDGVVTLPIVGYDTSKPQNLGLYRLVMMSALLYAEQNDLVFNASSGAPSFKRLRGAVPTIEYSAVYVKHLPFLRRSIWNVLGKILNKVFVPIMKRYQL